jgi:diguanylate cyclase (GGDEF)-like protein
VPQPPHRPFVAAVSGAGLGVVAAVAVAKGADVVERADALLLLLAASILVAELFPVRIPDDEGEVSFSTTFAFALLLTDGIAAVVLVHALALAISDGVRRRPFERLVFNVAQYAICWLLAGVALDLLSGALPERDGLQYLDARWLGALVAAASVFLVLNTAFASAPPALSRGVSPLTALRADLGKNAWWTAVLIALVPLVLVAADYSLWLLPLLGVPLAAIQLGSRQAVLNEHRASHDELTGLPNREHMAGVLREALRRGHRRGEHVGVLFVGLQRFKEVNDTLGHRRGDVVLVAVARRLAALARSGDLVARLGGDEFALVLPRIDGEEGCGQMADEVIAALGRPVVVRGIELDIGAAVGIACHPQHGGSVETLLRHADVALDKAKASRAHRVTYADDFDEPGQERLALVGELRRAIDEGQLELHFQPQVALATGSLRGVEALVRWRHPERGLLAPEDFIEPAEHTGLIRPLTMWVVAEALDQADRWRAQGMDIPVAVNLSVRSITPELPAELAHILASRTGLELEITETVGVDGGGEALAVLDDLNAMGIRLSVDDFGTGFSSLAYLKRLPVSAIKIDRSFVMEMDRDESDRAIVRSTVDLAHHLGMEAIAEGVESQPALDELRELGCHLAQGFLISPPLPAAELGEWLATTGHAGGSAAARRPAKGLAARRTI